MKKIMLVVFLTAGLLVFGRTGKTTLPDPQNHVYFIANQGQWPDDVQYLVKMNGLNAWITGTGIVYDYYRFYPSEPGLIRSFKIRETDNRISGIRKGHVVKMFFGQKIQGNQILAKEKQNSYFNYFIGNDPLKWINGVALYQSITLKDLYPGIDMELYIDHGNLRYDFVLQPGADPQQIRLTFDGADGVDVENGNLAIKTSVGDQIQGDIHAFQGNDKIDCQIIKVANGVAGFRLGDYDKSKTLRIDPLVYSTYLGGTSHDVARDVVLDGSDAMYIAGFTWSTDFPTTNGAYQRDLKGADDVFVSGFSPDGQNLVFSTFLGGSYSDEAYSLAYSNGKIYVTGVAFSEDFPITNGAFQEQNHLGGDVFVTSLSSDGQSLGFSTYVGGFGFDRPSGIEAGDNVLVGGSTDSDDFPVTGDAYDNTFGGGSPMNDGFVFKLSLTGSMIYSSYFGASGDDQINGICIDPTAPDVYYLTGQTTSSDFPVTDDAFDKQLGDGSGNGEDAFLSVFNDNQLEYSTYLGGTSTDYAMGVTANNSTSVMIAGVTFSDDFPVTDDAFSKTREGIYQDAFVTFLNPGASTENDELVYSSYFGGTFEEEVFGVFLDAPDKFYIAGYTASQNFPTTPGAVSQEAIGNMDAFLTRFNFTGNSMDYSTYLGGSFDDVGYGIAKKQNGQMVMSGMTMSFNFPVTDNAYDPTFNAENFSDAFLSVIGIVPTGIFEQQSNNPLHLDQNQPNPFSSVTTVTYALDEAGEAVLKVYDCTGKVVLQRTLPAQTTGKHQFELNMSGFPPGLYFYSLKTEEWVETRKMVIR
ncbi:MAG: T9SS type A sorting domain-containing protein [Chlorobi bacterium]|nr:T9SS type A sorting domain-containing protein [Chlorobiota bacterium]